MGTRPECHPGDVYVKFYVRVRTAYPVFKSSLDLCALISLEMSNMPQNHHSMKIRL